MDEEVHLAQLGEAVAGVLAQDYRPIQILKGTCVLQALTLARLNR